MPRCSYYVPHSWLRPQPEDEEGDMVNRFKVGCDPEFILLDANNKTIPANKYLRLEGPVGYDHNGRVAELRPTPALGTYQLIKNIHALINREDVTKIDAKFRAGAVCNQQCLGGHVHLGFQTYSRREHFDIDGNYFPKEIAPRCVAATKALDILTKVLEHLDILPRNESAERRQSSQGYGRLGDIRDSNGHMEYRSMASWLYDPKVAFLCLTAAKLAAVDPEGTLDALKTCTGFNKFSEWIEGFKSKDINAARLSERICERGLKVVQVDPSINFRERWQELSI